MAKVVQEVTSSVAMGHFDINKICEDLVCGILKELFDLPKLRNLNADEKANFPGIDLADDQARVAIQVTSDSSLEKIKQTLEKVVSHKIYEKYDRIVFYILTRRQNSYSEAAISRICDGHFHFDVRNDVLDQTNLSTKAATAAPRTLQSAVDVLLAYTRGTAVGLANEDFDPPTEPMEQIGTNLACRSDIRHHPFNWIRVKTQSAY